MKPRAYGSEDESSGVWALRYWSLAAPTLRAGVEALVVPNPALRRLYHLDQPNRRFRSVSARDARYRFRPA